MQEYFRQPIVDTFDIRICMSKSVKHSVDFSIASETDLHLIGMQKLISYSFSSQQWMLMFVGFFFLCRYSITISSITNGHLPWFSILVWCCVQWIDPTNLAINITSGTANTLVSSALPLTESNLCATRTNNIGTSAAGGKQTAKLWRNHQFACWRHQYGIIECFRFEKSIFPLHRRTDTSAPWNNHSITIWSVLVTLGHTTARISKWHADV